MTGTGRRRWWQPRAPQADKAEQRETAVLPDPDVLAAVARELADSAERGWTRLDHVVWWLADDVYGERMWVEGPATPRRRVQPPHDVGWQLHLLRERTDPPVWQRCDIALERSPGSDEPTFQVQFAYEVGEVPE